MASVGAKCRVRSELASVMRNNKTTVRVRFENGSEKTVPFSDVQLVKVKSLHKNAKRSNFDKSSDCKYKPYKRVAPKPSIAPTRFQGFNKKWGNFHYMLQDKELRERTICIFNDNLHQWEYAGNHPDTQQNSGGGNACARPYEVSGHSIGICTGPFDNLNSTYFVQFPGEAGKTSKTAKEIINENIMRIVRLCLARPEKTILFFSVNPDDPPDSTRLGLAIFAGSVGSDVIDYISMRLQQIPEMVKFCRLNATDPKNIVVEMSRGRWECSFLSL